MADLSIWANALRPPKSIADYDAEAQKQQMNALAMQQDQIGLQDARRKMAQAAELDAIYRGLPQGSIADQSQYLLNSRHPGAVTAGQKMQDEEAARQLKLAQAGHATSQTGEAQAKTAETKQKMMLTDAHQEATSVMMNPTEDLALKSLMRLATKHDMPPSALADAMAEVRSFGGDPNKIKAWAAGKAGMAAEKLLPVSHTIELGDMQGFYSVDPVTTNITPKGAMPIGVSPNTMATNERAAQEGAANRSNRWDIAAMHESGANARAAQRSTVEKPLPTKIVEKLQEARDNATTLERASDEFKNDFGSKGVLGFGADAQLATGSVLGMDKDAVEWWKNYRKQTELVERHSLFGSALSQREQASWKSADINPGMDPSVIKRNLATRKKLAQQVLENTKQDLVDAGYSEDKVRSIADRRPSSQSDTPVQLKSEADYLALKPGTRFITPDGKPGTKK